MKDARMPVAADSFADVESVRKLPRDPESHRSRMRPVLQASGLEMATR